MTGESIPTKKYFCSDCGNEITRHALTGKCKSCSHRNKPLSQAHRDAISKGNLDKHPSDETKQKISRSHESLQAGVKNGMYGRSHTPETRKLMSGARTHPDKRKTRKIYCYIGYDNDLQKEAVWSQKVDGCGQPQGTGSFYFRTIRRKNMNSLQLSLPCPGCQWHHVNEDMVVAVPTHIHRGIKHTCGDGNMIEGIIG